MADKTSNNCGNSGIIYEVFFEKENELKSLGDI